MERKSRSIATRLLALVICAAAGALLLAPLALGQDTNPQAGKTASLVSGQPAQDWQAFMPQAGGPSPISYSNSSPGSTGSIQPGPTADSQVSDALTTYDSYFTWYDNIYGYTWLLGANPGGQPDATYNMYLKGELLGTLPTPAGTTNPVRYPNRLGGPIRASSDQYGTFASERSLFGNSFEEVWATPYGQLGSHYYWPNYIGFMMDDWILVANPLENGEAVRVDLSIVTPPDPQTGYDPPDIFQQQVIQPGDTWTPSFPGVYGENVQVKAYQQYGSPDNPSDARKVVASQRTLFQGAFNELPGIPESQLDGDYEWTWYDAVNSDSAVTLGNPNSQPVFAGVYVAGQQVIGNWLQPGQVGSWWDHTHTMMNGPVEARACWVQDCSTGPANIYASEQEFYGPSYEEVAGTPWGALGSTSNWTWYDEVSSGSLNWVLVANPYDNASIYYRITVAGQVPAGYIGSAPTGIIPANGRVTPRFPGIMNGPVKVEAWYDAVGGSQPANVLSSQRVLWNGYFNEVVGKGM